MKNLILSGNYLGRGNEEIGKILMEKFFLNLAQGEDLPEKIFFYNTAVFLCMENSFIINELKILEEKGVELLACTTCLEYFKIEIVQFIKKSGMKELINIIGDDCIIL